MPSDEDARRAVRDGTDPASRPNARQVEAISFLTYDSYAVEVMERMLKRRLDPKHFVTAEVEHTLLMLRDCVCTASVEFVAFVKGDLAPLVPQFYSKDSGGSLRGVHRAAGSLLSVLRDEASLARERRLHLPISNNRVGKRNVEETRILTNSPTTVTETFPITPDTPSSKLPRERKVSLKADYPTRAASSAPRTSRHGGLSTPGPSPLNLQSQLAPESSPGSVTSLPDVKSAQVEHKVRAVTSNTPPPITPKQMEEIAEMTYDPTELEAVRIVIDTRLDALKPQPAYHHLVKTLTLIHHCLFYASDEFVELCRQRQGVFEKLYNFRCPSSDVQSRVGAILDRLEDETRLHNERKSRKALSNRRRTSSDPNKLSKTLTLSPPLTPNRRNSLPDEEYAPVPIVEKIGEHAAGFGGYSDVWKGRLTTDEGATYTLVAVKILRLGATRGADPDRLQKRLEREVRVWQNLDHESIADFHGVVYGASKSPAIISSWYEKGSADIYLQKYPDANPMKTLWEIVLGVEYLHDRGIVHGDLKGGNVMVDKFGHAKLIDFGLSRLIDSVSGATGLTTSSVAFSIRWCAPELVRFDDSQTTKATDVYAFASTALQLLTGEVPYSAIKERAVMLKVIEGVRPRTCSSGLRYYFHGAERVWSLLESCWKDAALRPSIAEVKEKMRIFYP